MDADEHGWIWRNGDGVIFEPLRTLMDTENLGSGFVTTRGTEITKGECLFLCLLCFLWLVPFVLLWFEIEVSEVGSG